MTSSGATTHPSVLLVVHALPPEEETGVPLVAYGYARELTCRGWHVAVVYGSNAMTDWEAVQLHTNPDEGFVRIAVPTGPIVGSLWAVSAASLSLVANALPNVTFERILRELEPDILHVIDNVNLPLDWPERAAAREIPVVRTVSCVEDLCALIAPVSPISDSVGYCLPPLTPQRCAACVASSDEAPHVTSSLSKANDDRSDPAEHQRTLLIDFLQRKRARAAAQYADTFDRIVFSSNAFRSYFERSLPLSPDRVRVISLGIDPPPERTRPTRARENKQVVFGFAGTLYEAKGLDTLVETFLSPEMLERNDFRLELFGDGNSELIEELLAVNPNVRWHGAYQLEDLPVLLDGVDVGLSTSRFETFHRVTREYLFAGLPVIGSMAFGIPEIISDGENGLLFDHEESGSMLRAVLSCLNDRALLAKLTQGARDTVIKSVGQEVEQLEALYRECL